LDRHRIADLTERLRPRALKQGICRENPEGAQLLRPIALPHDSRFSRLNEAVPLNAPEKRNALGGPMPKRIRALANLAFFHTRLPFPTARYRHLDLATKFLYLEDQDGLTDLKKERSRRLREVVPVQELAEEVEGSLRQSGHDD
jgi:hypothetical protein